MAEETRVLVVEDDRGIAEGRAWSSAGLLPDLPELIDLDEWGYPILKTERYPANCAPTPAKPSPPAPARPSTPTGAGHDQHTQAPSVRP
ncbi:hypothetical protein [Streptomyces broussonetiae]|uniref:hypothetical protein n=1 Tax=Streptomyces broussonetiae TaxID=2686304 RepID=UPI0035D7F8E0